MAPDRNVSVSPALQAYGRYRFRWNARRLWRRLLVPVLGGSAVAVVLPWAIVALHMVGSSDVASHALLSASSPSLSLALSMRADGAQCPSAGRFVHPFILLMGVGYIASQRAWAAFDVWSGKVRLSPLPLSCLRFLGRNER